MSREIKFRVYDKWTKQMLPVLSIDCKETFSSERGDNVLMQYTGLKDKNDKEIYEGDIVKIDETEDIDVVNWSDSGEFAIGFGLFSCFQYEVIGNIYKNPELLKEN